MKKYWFFYLVLLFVGCKPSNSSVNNKYNNEGKFNKTEYLKQYAFCQCAYIGLKADSITKKDNSTWGAVDICDCNPTILHKLDSMAQAEAKLILPIQTSGDTTKRPVLNGCIEFYKSKKLDSLISLYKLKE